MENEVFPNYSDVIAPLGQGNFKIKGIFLFPYIIFLNSELLEKLYSQFFSPRRKVKISVSRHITDSRVDAALPMKPYFSATLGAVKPFFAATLVRRTQRGRRRGLFA